MSYLQAEISASIPYLILGVMAIVAVILIMLVAGYTDMMKRVIPNRLVIVLLGLVLSMNYFQRGVNGLVMGMITILLITLLFYPFFVIGKLGAGDIKLLSICSTIFYGDQILKFLFVSFVLALILGILMNLFEGMKFKREGVPMAIPIGIAILIMIGGI